MSFLSAARALVANNLVKNGTKALAGNDLVNTCEYRKQSYERGLAFRMYVYVLVKSVCACLSKILRNLSAC